MRLALMEPSAWGACASCLAARVPSADRGICFHPSVIRDWSATWAIRRVTRVCRLVSPATCATRMRRAALSGQVVFGPAMPTFVCRTAFAAVDACRDRRVATRVWFVPAPATVAAVANLDLHQTPPVRSSESPTNLASRVTTAVWSQADVPPMARPAAFVPRAASVLREPCARTTVERTTVFPCQRLSPTVCPVTIIPRFTSAKTAVRMVFHASTKNVDQRGHRVRNVVH